MQTRDHITLVIENKQFKDLNPIFFGRDKCSPGKAMNIPFRDFHLIHYVISGKGRLCINDTWHSVSSQQIFIIPMNTKNYYVADTVEPWDYIWIGFGGKLAGHFAQLPSVINFPHNLFFDMLEVCELDIMREEFLAEKLFSLYRLLFSKQIGFNYCAAIKNSIKTSYMDSSLSVETIAQNLGLNRSYLSRMFKQKYECSIQEYLIRTRITKAIEYLEMGYNVQQVSVLVGYTNASNFSKSFKKYTGSAPQKYQQQKNIENNSMI